MRGMDEFKFDIGDVVLAEWEDKVFYAKIQKIDKLKSFCHLIFDDNSVEECPFSKIHSVTETTAEIVCIICKDGTSAQPNEIVLCDKCGIGYHQKCHDPPIPAKALVIEEPWMCRYCAVGAFCPYLQNPFETKDKRADPLRRRRIQPLSGENSVVTNSWNSHGHRLLTKSPVSHGMSGFYYTSPSQHREGHRARGRPPFSHKKHINDKRGRGLGRSPSRNQTRERDYQNERDSEQETRKHYSSKHNSEMQHRAHSRYNSPSRNNKHGDDVDSSGSDRSQTNKDLDSIPTSNSLRTKENTSSKQAVSLKQHHRKDPPREKQRLTQDLARQKRLLSEDLARNQLLQREQITNNYDVVDKKDTDSDSAQDQCDDVEDKDECISEKEGELTMYQKCYGNYSAESPGDESPEESQRHVNNSNYEKMEKSESLFERKLHRETVAGSKHIEFVNESQLEMRSDEEKNDSDHVNAKPLSPTADTASKGDLNRKVKLPVFENVTDDELTISDNESSAHLKHLHDVSSNALVTGAEGSKMTYYSDSQLQDKHSSENELDQVKSVCSSKELVNDCNDKMTCQCTTHEGSDNDTNTVQYNGNGSKEMSGKSTSESDQSTIKASSKMSQILDEPDVQCEHSLRNENANKDDGISIPNDLKSDVDINSAEISNVRINSNSKDSIDFHSEGTTSSIHGDTEELDKNKELDSASVDQDTDLSNNEGMSDAEELSDSEPATSSGKSKIKRKTRKKSKSSKNLVKVTSSPQRQPRRSKSGRRLGRPPKTSKQQRQIESDSDEQPNVGNYESKSDSKDTNSKSQSPAKELNEVDSTQDSSKHDDSQEFENKTSKEDVVDESKEVEDIEEDQISPEDSDTEDANQDIFSLTEEERLQYEEQGRKERVRKDKRIAARQKRKSVERDRENERATPPHLVSQNRFARDLPRHNWLVERLLQQKKLGQEALKQDDENSDNAEGNSDQESRTDTISTMETNVDAEQESQSQEKPKETLSDSGEASKEDPTSPLKDEFQSELHKSFLRRSFPTNVPRTPPKLKPASPESTTSSENKPLPPPLKHKLQTKEHSILEPVPKLKKIVPESSTRESDETSKEEEVNSDVEIAKDVQSSGKQQSPIEILDDDEEKKKIDSENDSKTAKSSSSPVITSSFSLEKAKDEDSSSKFSSFSPPKKPLSFPPPKKVVHSVSPTLPVSGKELTSPHPMGPHHRAAILIPVVPMHDANGLPLPPSLGPTSPHMKPYSPRTFTPHLITHNPPFSTAGLFSGPPANRYPGGSCHHHFHPGMKPGPCKRDVNCPFHGSPTRALPGGIMGIPSHHPSMTAFNSPHEHISHMLAREHREGQCPNSDCKVCRQGKESPKIRELEAQSNNEKKSPQPNKVVKPIAHVPGMRPPLMLSHLQQFGGRPAHSYSEIDSIQEEKARRSGLDPLLSPRSKVSSTSPDRLPRDPLVQGLFMQERRSLPQPMTLSDLNRRREQEYLKGPPDSLLSANKHRPLHSEFVVPGFSPPSNLNKPGLIHPKDSTLFSSSRSQPVMSSQHEKRDLNRMEERERNAFFVESLKSGPPRLRPDEKVDVHVLRNFNEQKKLEDITRRENPSTIRDAPTSKESSGMPPPKLFEDREVPREPSRDQPFPRTNKDFEARLLNSHGNSSILGPGLRSLEENRKLSEEDRKRDDRAQETRRTVESESREREIREEQAMNALEASHRRSIEQMREKEQEKRNLAEREGLRTLTPMERDRMKQQILRGPEAEKHFKPTFGMPRERSPPFLRRDPLQERLLTVDPSKPGHRLDLRAAALQDLQRRQEMFRTGEGSHRELLGRIASSYSANKSNHPTDKSFPERFHPEMSRAMTDIRSHSPTRGYPLSLASRQAMDRLAAAAQGKSIPIGKEMEKEIPMHLRTEMEREREKEHHRLTLEQIDVNRRLLQAELKEKVNPLVLNREIGPRDREKEMAALRARERLMIERERHMAFERLAEERRRKRDAGEMDGPFLLPGRHIASPPYGRAMSEFERAKRARLEEHIATSSSYNPLLTPHLANSFHGKPKDDHLPSPKGPTDQRLGRPLDLELPNKNASSVLERDAIWLRERERVMRAKEELSRIQPKVSHSLTNHVPGFVNSKERAEAGARDSESSGKPEDESVNLCSVCKRDASFLCSGCQGAWYCSTECQLSAWAKHSRDCGQSQRQ